ncbi:MAG: tRNA pseudouridine(38-40) synthase TruA [Firmicutes bacterium]|nr:tRNA pseudouridine(38-40) synthase TruA [Bacillota bacterium]
MSKHPARNLLLTIEYDGTGFSGWQRQPGRKTVQGELERVLTSVCGQEIKIDGTSRTDAGVHAYGQRANFKGEFGIPTDKLAMVVNHRLAGGKRGRTTSGPIRITEVQEMPMDFHARFDARGKTYIYRLYNSPELDVFRRNYCYRIGQPLDTEAMKAAAREIEGTHDFQCFQASGSEERLTTVRTVYKADIRSEGKNVDIFVTGDGFLYNMVRIITGTLVEVGLGKMDPAHLARIIKSRDRQNAGHTAPPQGLYLARVYYETKEIPGYEEGTPGLG